MVIIDFNSFGSKFHSLAPEYDRDDLKISRRGLGTTRSFLSVGYGVWGALKRTARYPGDLVIVILRINTHLLKRRCLRMGNMLGVGTFQNKFCRTSVK
jgi:hypothetical protein